MALFTSTQLTPHVGVGTHILSFFLLWKPMYQLKKT
jgi:hypothetical protein